MELCPGGHLVGLMNKRLQATNGSMFKESEILQIFQDVCEGVAQMHTQTPPFAHRDIKVLFVYFTRCLG